MNFKNNVARLLGLIGAATAIGVLLPANAQERDDKPAQELVGGPWLNTRQGAPVTLASRRGKVTVVHFWTYGCINCRHNLPAYARLQKKFAAQNVQIIGVHTPETRGEKATVNVARAIKQHDISYPVLVDGNSANWNRWGQKYWPTVYLIDKQGHVRQHWEGELGYNGADGEAQLSHSIEKLLQEK